MFYYKTRLCILQNLVDTIHINCLELSILCKENIDKLKITSIKDKGALGKIVEFFIFGNIPNSIQEPDMIYGDIKTTHFKRSSINPSYYNAKERLTLTNVGNTQTSNVINELNKNSIKETKYFEKIRRGIIIIFLHNNHSTKLSSLDDLWFKEIIGIIHYDLNDLFIRYPSIEEEVEHDFQLIRKRVVSRNVSQRGQKTIHIHKHRGRESMTRALGFTNKFITRLVGLYLNKPILNKGSSIYVEL